MNLLEREWPRGRGRREAARALLLRAFKHLADEYGGESARAAAFIAMHRRDLDWPIHPSTTRRSERGITV